MKPATSSLDTPTALREFNQRLADARRGVFLFDYDGTLAPFVSDPPQARPYDGVAQALDALMDTGGARVVVVTGRYLKSAPPVLGTKFCPEMWGSHGRERLWPDGRYEIAPVDPYAVRALTIADSWTGEIEAAGGRAEAKPGSLALHWRGTGPSQVMRIRQLVTGKFHREAFEDVLEIRTFDGGIELRAPGIDKGHVIRTLLAETGASVPVAFLGDDLTDEDAFKALHGRGLGVLVRPEYRPTAADLWVLPPQMLLLLLARWRDALGRVP